MEALRALVLTDLQLQELLAEAAKQGAAIAIGELRADLHQSPDDKVLQRLRTYLTDPGSVPSPRECWAHSGIICRIQPSAHGKARSTAWFMKFQRETGLHECQTRQSPTYGRRREWTFADIKLAWDTYYRR